MGKEKMTKHSGLSGLAATQTWSLKLCLGVGHHQLISIEKLLFCFDYRWQNFRFKYLFKYNNNIVGIYELMM